MRKLLIILCIALLATSVVMSCKPPGMLCAEDADCCEPFACNVWAKRCTKKSQRTGRDLPGNPPDGSVPSNPL